jgi:transcriptional regulator with PAS, ATPase and Fis domain
MMNTTKPDLDLQSLIDTHANPFVLIDRNYTIVAANRSYCSSYARAPEEIVGRKCHSVSHHFDTPCYLNGENCPLKITLDTNEAYEVLHIHFDQYNLPERVRIKGHPIAGSDGTRYVGEEIIRLSKDTDLDFEEQQLIGRSEAFRRCMEGLACISGANDNALLTGERGTGKHLAARYLHHHSTRKGRSFVTVDCSAIKETEFESVLFGQERGIFAGCIGRRPGLLEEADGGSLFLNEAGDIPLSIQGRLLTTIDSGKYRRVGGRDILSADLRIISSTSKDLPAMIETGKFRPDLYLRLAGVTHAIPPLRDRREDIPALADALIVRYCDNRNPFYHIREDARQRLVNHDYPGNLRELHTILQEAIKLSDDGLITDEHIRIDESRSDPEFSRGSTETGSPGQSIKEMEAELIAVLLEHYQGHRRRVADELGISERTLYRKLEKYGLTTVGKQN